MSLSIGFDYSGGRLTGQAVKSAGGGFVIRYVALGGSSKWIDAGEYASMRAAGVTVLFVAERDTTDADGGYVAGQINATAARNYIVSIGAPANSLIFAANDRNVPVTPAQLDYVRAFRDVLGVNSTGAYGFTNFIQAVRSAGTASVLWQAGVQPYASSGVHFWQRNAGTTQETISGVTVDINDQLLPLPNGAAVDMPLTPQDIDAIWAYQVPTPNYGAPGRTAPISMIQSYTDARQAIVMDAISNLTNALNGVAGNVNDVHAALLTGSKATPAGQSLVTLFGNIATVVAQIAAKPTATVDVATVESAVTAAFTTSGYSAPPAVGDIAAAVLAEVRNVTYKAV